jgi:hypothetical protein
MTGRPDDTFGYSDLSGYSDCSDTVSSTETLKTWRGQINFNDWQTRATPVIEIPFAVAWHRRGKLLSK